MNNKAKKNRLRNQEEVIPSNIVGEIGLFFFKKQISHCTTALESKCTFSRRQLVLISPRDKGDFFFSFCLFRAAPTAYGSSRIGAELELQLLAYATVTAMQYPAKSVN